MLGDDAPALWAEELSQVCLRGTRVMREVAFFHRASRTLILVDLVENMTAGDFFPRSARGRVDLGGRELLERRRLAVHFDLELLERDRKPSAERPEAVARYASPTEEECCRALARALIGRLVPSRAHHRTSQWPISTFKSSNGYRVRRKLTGRPIMRS